MGKFKVYLCGPINGCTDSQALDWRRMFTDILRINMSFTWVDPMKRDYRGKELDNYREIVELDKRDIKKCSAMVVMYIQPSVGTSMEVFIAWTIGIPVIVIDKSNKPISPWLKYHSTTVVKDEFEAVDKLEEWFLK